MLLGYITSTGIRRPVFAAIVIWSICVLAAAYATIPSFGGAQIPSLAPLLRAITPAVVSISVRGLVREDNPLYQDLYFRQFFDVPKQLERRIEAAGSGVIVDVDRGYALTNSHVVEHASNIRSGRRTVKASVQRSSGAMPLLTLR